jgi:hypothetical protein
VNSICLLSYSSLIANIIPESYLILHFRAVVELLCWFRGPDQFFEFILDGVAVEFCL